MTKTFWLIRHGESEANAGLATSNPSDINLTEAGRAQAAGVAQQFPQAPDLIVTSKYIRTQQTAQPTRERFPDVPHEEWNIHEYTYLSQVKCANTTIEDRRSMVAEYWSRQDPFYNDGDNAESFATMIGRVRDLLSRLRSTEHDFVAVFCHAQFIQALMWELQRGSDEISGKTMLGYKAFQSSFHLKNAAILQLKLVDGDMWQRELR